MIWRLIYTGFLNTKVSHQLRNDSRFKESPTVKEWIDYTKLGEFKDWTVLWYTRANDPSKRPSLLELKNWVLGLDMA